MKSKLPTIFNLGHLKYKIVYAQPGDELLKSDTEYSLDGLHSQSRGALVVNACGEYTEDYIRLVLLHEIIHAIVTAHGIPIDCDVIENVADGLSFGFIQAMHQNPWMATLFSKDVGGK